MKPVFLLMMLALTLAAQPKKLTDAQVKPRAATGGLSQQIQSLLSEQPQPAWLSYIVPAAKGRNFGCDNYYRDNEFTAGGGVVHLEPPQEILILMRINNGQVSQIRTIAPDCEIAAGGVPFYWLSGVQLADSVATLSNYVKPGGRLAESAVNAIGMHAGPAADSALDKFLGRDQPESVRVRAAHYMGTTRGARGIEKLKPIITSDPDTRVSKAAVQAIASNTDPGAIDVLIGVAKSDKSAGVRSEALRALARKGGPKALATISSAIDSDPEREVRKNAVNALKSLPDGEGIPLLIQAARSHKDLDVRKNAMSALGQSRDPRASAFFEDVLKK